MRQWLDAGSRTAARQQAETSSEPQSATSSGSQSTRTWELALARDDNSCVLTWRINPEVAHIVPFSLGRLGGLLRQTMPNIEAILRVLAGPKVVRNLEQYLLQGHGSRNQIDRVENLICLSPDAHYYFGSGYIVLEPVEDPLAGIQSSTDVLSSYDVRFSWVTGNRPGTGVRVCNDLQEDAWDLTQVLDPGVPMSDDSDPEVSGLHLGRPTLRRSNRRRLPIQALETGFIFTLTTNDPVHHPLPHPDLLVLHAAVMRVCRAAGMSKPEADEEWEFPDEVDVQARIQDQFLTEDPSDTLRCFLEAGAGSPDESGI
ncbi:hypothetical protein BGX38DRAFT_1259469 [Terfezia claveryi]|nr:hypothetical protein BGX38DRAFT_1259469 [Terfezia claveryi]